MFAKLDVAMQHWLRRATMHIDKRRADIAGVAECLIFWKWIGLSIQDVSQISSCNIFHHQRVALGNILIDLRDIWMPRRIQAYKQPRLARKIGIDKLPIMPCLSKHQALDDAGPIETCVMCEVCFAEPAFAE